MALLLRAPPPAAAGARCGGSSCRRRDRAPFAPAPSAGLAGLGGGRRRQSPPTKAAFRGRGAPEGIPPGGRLGSPAGSSPDSFGGAELASEFSKFVNKLDGQAKPASLETTGPSPLITPPHVVSTVMDALSSVDYPEPGSGYATAFRFSVPHGVDAILPGSGTSSVTLARSWDAREGYIPREAFRALFQGEAFAPMVGCCSWQMASPLEFTGDNSATQTVVVVGSPLGAGSPEECSSDAYDGGTFTYTFNLECPSGGGAYTGCWLVREVTPGPRRRA